jgi:hypothetical protein
MRKNFSRFFVLGFLCFGVVAVWAQTASQPLVTTPVTAPAKNISFSMIYANSMKDRLPWGVFNKTGWVAESSDQYVKLHLYADEPFYLSRLEIQSCGAEFTDDALLYINFNEVLERLLRDYKFQFKALTSSAQVNVGGVRSLTINFQKNKNVCVSEIRLYDENGVPYSVKIPQVVMGTAQASSTLEPALSYDVMNLFDSRYEYAWSSKGEGTAADVLDFTFATPQTINKIKLWNGYQRSDTHCFSNGRAKKIVVTGDGDFSQTLTVADIMGSQVLAFAKPFTGTRLKITIPETYAGKTYRDLVVSELRFGNDQGWLTLNPLPFMQKVVNENRQKFLTANMGQILNASLVGEHTQVANANKQKYGEWTLRLRSDGSLYVEGYTDAGGDSMHDFTALGNYEIQEATPGQIKIRIFGLMRKKKYDQGGDCNGCGRDCNLKANSNNAEEEKIFQDNISIVYKDYHYLVTNLSKVKKLGFDTLDLKLE